MLKALNFHAVALNIRNISKYINVTLYVFCWFYVVSCVLYHFLLDITTAKAPFSRLPSLSGRNSIAVLESPTISGGLPVIPINDGVIQKKSLDQIGYDEVTLSNKSNVKN